MAVKVRTPSAWLDDSSKDHRIGVFVALSDSVDYDDGAVAVFSLPEHCYLVSLGVDVETAFNAGSCKLVLSDPDSATLMTVGEPSLMVARPVVQMIGKELADGGDITATVTTGSATAGSFKVWAEVRFNSQLQVS